MKRKVFVLFCFEPHVHSISPSFEAHGDDQNMKTLFFFFFPENNCTFVTIRT